jgi:hypothetical protein
LTRGVRVLERAQLIVSHKVGRERKLYFNVVPIQIIYDRWATDFSALWAGQLTRLHVYYLILISDERVFVRRSR